MEEQSFNLKLTFSDSVSNKSQLQEIANNVLRAIVGECNCGLGISPSDGDTVTLKISIQHNDIKDIQAKEELY